MVLLQKPTANTTTIRVVATDAVLDKAGATQLALLAHHGLARAVSPIGINDGDGFFAFATGARGVPCDLTQPGALAAEVVAHAIRSAMRAAHGLAEPAPPSAADLIRR